MQSVNDIFASLADSSRLRILLLIRDMELAMGELAEVLGQSQPRVSRHVRILAECGLVDRHKEGARVYVRLGSRVPVDALYAFIDSLLGDKDPCAVERARLLQVRAERQKAVDSWFDANAAEWDLMRRLEGSDDAFARAIVDAARGGRGVGRLLDIGTGTGRMLELLGGDASYAMGVDRSPEMLRIARAKLSAGELSSAEVRQADMRALPFEPHGFDTVIMHQVLHFADDPASVVGEAARMVAPGGRLLIADYAAHSHEQLSARFQHLRLGFEEAAVSGWMAATGLVPAVVARQAGPELTSILWEGVRPCPIN